MPVYEYACEACGTTGQRILRVAERNDPECPACGKPWELQVSVPRLISGEFPAKIRMEAFPDAPEVTDKDELRHYQEKYGTRTLEEGEAVGPQAVKDYRERSLAESKRATEEAVDHAMNTEQFRQLDYGPAVGDQEHPWKDPAVEESGGFTWVPKDKKVEDVVQPLET